MTCNNCLSEYVSLNNNNITCDPDLDFDFTHYKLEVGEGDFIECLGNRNYYETSITTPNGEVIYKRETQRNAPYRTLYESWCLANQQSEKYHIIDYEYDVIEKLYLNHETEVRKEISYPKIK